MGNEDLLKQVTAKAQIWLGDGYDEETKAAVRAMLDNEDKTDLIEAFYKDLEFGTGGLRGIMGAGTNRMNIYTVGAATQGLSNYLKKAFADLLPPEILHRNKRGFQIPVAAWLRGRMRPLMEDLLSEARLREQGIFNPRAVRALMNEHISGRADLRKPLWTLLVFQLWWQARKSN